MFSSQLSLSKALMLVWLLGALSACAPKTQQGGGPALRSVSVDGAASLDDATAALVSDFFAVCVDQAPTYAGSARAGSARGYRSLGGDPPLYAAADGRTLVIEDGVFRDGRPTFACSVAGPAFRQGVTAAQVARSLRRRFALVETSGRGEGVGFVVGRGRAPEYFVGVSTLSGGDRFGDVMLFIGEW